jgi:hypothetical protein
MRVDFELARPRIMAAWVSRVSGPCWSSSRKVSEMPRRSLGTAATHCNLSVDFWNSAV